MIKKFFVTLIACSAVLVGCNNDDDNGIDKNTTIPLEERNSIDDKAIKQFLEDYYLEPVKGKLTKFDDVKDNEDDKYPALITYAKQDPLGYWYAENPNHSGTDKTIESSDKNSIYLHYQTTVFLATNDTVKANNASQKFYGAFSLGNYDSSINAGDGSAKKDPSFYYTTLSETNIKDGIKREHIELKNFAIALQHFKSTKRPISDLYNFQGIIILPSRLAFGRNKVYTGNGLSEYTSNRDRTFIFNFELPEIEDRKTE